MEAQGTQDLITTAEAAGLLGVDRSGVIRRVKAGDLTPAMTLPGKTGSHLFERADVLALLVDSAAGSRGDAGDPLRVEAGSAPSGDVPDPVTAGGHSSAA